MTQTEVGEYLHISRRSYAHFEAGTRGIPVEILASLADLYGVNVDYLIGRTDRKEMLPPPEKGYFSHSSHRSGIKDAASLMMC